MTWLPEPSNANAAFERFYYSPAVDCLIAETVAGPKRYARLFGSAFDHVEWGWVLPDDAIPLAPESS